MAERQRHPWLAGLIGLVTLEAVAFGGLFLFMLRDEGWAVGLELTPIVVGVGSALLLVVLLGGAWCAWRAWSGGWGLREPGSRVIAPRGTVPASDEGPPAAPQPPGDEAPPAVPRQPKAAAINLLPGPTEAEAPAAAPAPPESPAGVPGQPDSPPAAPDEAPAAVPEAPSALPGYPVAPRRLSAPEDSGKTSPAAPGAAPAAPHAPPALPSYPVAPRRGATPAAREETAPDSPAEEPLTVKLEAPQAPPAPSGDRAAAPETGPPSATSPEEP